MSRASRVAHEAPGGASSTGSFPGFRLFVTLAPGVFIFLFFPFRTLQWMSLLSILFITGAFTLSYLLYRGAAVRAIVPVSFGYRNDEIAIELEVRNGAPVPAINLGITLFTPSEIPGRQKAQALLTIARRSYEPFSTVIRMTRRGEYPVSPIVLEGADPFGLFPWSISVRNLTRLVVYPSIRHGRLSPKRGVPGGAIRVANRLYDDVNRIGSIRDYIPGDDIRRIHWKVTAKSGSLRVSELLPAMDAPAVVIFDMDAAAYPLRYRYEQVEAAVEIVASLVHALTEAWQRVGLVSNGLDGNRHPLLPPADRSESAAMALRVLARIAASYEVADPITMFLEAGFPIRAGMGCFIVTPRSPESLASRLMHPTMVALKPTYYHLGDRRAELAPGLAIGYAFVKRAKEIFG